jgi:predicted GH43/DUF377 family glycosyl hydrolase
MLYRAQDTDGVSRLGYADSTDGIHFARKPEPVFAPEGSYEIGGGVEDPRRVKIDRLYYMTYTGYNKQDAQLCLATSRDLIHWDRKGHSPSRIQGQVELRMDQIRRHPHGKNRRQILDVLAGNIARS